MASAKNTADELDHPKEEDPTSYSMPQTHGTATRARRTQRTSTLERRSKSRIASATGCFVEKRTAIGKRQRYREQMVPFARQTWRT